MKAISLWQPWASAIAAGVKTIETRSWSTPYRGPLAIHAAKRWTRYEQEFWYTNVPILSETASQFATLGIRTASMLPLGCVVATCEIYDCLSTSSDTDAAKLAAHSGSEDEESWGNYSENRFAWLLRNIKAIKPVPCVGRQGFFDWPAPQKPPAGEGRA
jgi:hypothetical protein